MDLEEAEDGWSNLYSSGRLLFINEKVINGRHYKDHPIPHPILGAPFIQVKVKL